jgi:hypothetical protein
MKKLRPPSEELIKLLAVYEVAVGELALGLRELVLAEAPNANELIYDAYNAVAIAYSFTEKWQQGFCHIAVYSRYANLGFQRGAELADPAGVLKGTGKLIRHIRVASKDDLRQPCLRQYLRAAIELDAPAPKAQKQPARSVVIGTSGKKRRPSA